MLPAAGSKLTFKPSAIQVTTGSEPPFDVMTRRDRNGCSPATASGRVSPIPPVEYLSKIGPSNPSQASTVPEFRLTGVRAIALPASCRVKTWLWPGPRPVHWSPASRLFRRQCHGYRVWTAHRHPVSCERFPEGERQSPVWVCLIINLGGGCGNGVGESYECRIISSLIYDRATVDDQDDWTETFTLWCMPRVIIQ